MAVLSPRIAFIGFGEAGMAFAPDALGPIVAYDRKTDAVGTRAAKLDDYARAGVVGTDTNLSAVSDAPLILSVVTADQALAAAEDTARGIAADALYCDLNSVAPDTKRAAAAAIETAGGRYADIAVMAPVRPGGRAVPLLVSGPHAADAAKAMGAAGFGDVRVVGTRVGDASAIKMIRSVMVKGIEALTAECVLAADRAGVLDAVLTSLDASWPGADWRTRADYNLDRMMVHGLRRAAEMAEVVETLDALGTGSAMSRAAVELHYAIGRLGVDPPRPLTGKIAAVLDESGRRAA